MPSKTKNCKNCKHFRLGNYSGIPNMGECENQLLVATYSTVESDIADKGLVTECDEGWGFTVGPNFGCIHFEVAV